jgi:DNA repair protein RadA/Sms
MLYPFRGNGYDPQGEKMPREGPSFECTACGQTSQKWLGRCPTCGGWNTFEATPEKTRSDGRTDRAGTTGISLAQADLEDSPRLTTGLAGVDRVLGGGLVPGSVVLLAGEPGVGKSTLLLQIAARMSSRGMVLYVSAEESARQVALRARRLGCDVPGVLLLAESVVEAAIEESRRRSPSLVIVDSVQTMLSERVPAVPGSVTQVREVASLLFELAKRGGPPVLLAGHVTKEGLVAGPKTLEHLVDAVLEFSGAASQAHRVLRSTKNRFGPTLELALFAMGDAGLTEVANPSAVLLADRTAGAAGSAVAVVIEGTTPLLVEVQALVSHSFLTNPRRVAQGVDAGRLALLLAVLEKRAGMRLADRDVFVNVVGGVTVDEPALDVAVAAALLSAGADRPLPGDAAFFGEVGLLGEVRGVSRAAERIREAAALGFARCALPAAASEASCPPGFTLIPLRQVADLAGLLLPRV